MVLMSRRQSPINKYLFAPNRKGSIVKGGVFANKHKLGRGYQ